MSEHSADQPHPDQNPDEMPSEPTPGSEGPARDPELPEASTSTSGSEPLPHGPPVFGRFASLIVVVPFVVYLAGMMIGGYIEQLREKKVEGRLRPPGAEESRLPLDEEERPNVEVDPNEKFLGAFYLGRNSYPYTYTFTIGLTALLMLVVSWGYFRAPFRISWLSFVVGAVGVVVWIGLVYLDDWTIQLGGRLAERTAFNPFEELAYDRQWMWQFIAIRFAGLVLIVPIVEEFFVRGFLMRYVDDPDWDTIPLGYARWGGLIAPTVYGVVAHLAEPLAALAWFSMVTWLYMRTRSIWDCVVAHAVTNLLLGLYIIQFDEWRLW